VRLQEQGTLFNAADTVSHTTHVKDHDFSRDSIELQCVQHFVTERLNIFCVFFNGRIREVASRVFIR
jgi:hypothetical protein